MFAEVLLNWLADVLGPLTTFHVPVPTDGALADKVAGLTRHTFWSEPAAAAVGRAAKATATSSVLGVQDPFEIVQRKV